MKKLFALALSGACSMAVAQTPATNPMPDGSRDMYVGLGVVSAPRYEGARERRVSALPLLQVQWSNGVFVSGLAAGMHLAAGPSLEYGPLLALDPGRDDSGVGAGAGGVMNGLAPSEVFVDDKTGRAGRLGGMDTVKARLQGGFFANVYLDPQWRLSNSVLYGAGQHGDGLAWQLDLQRFSRSFAQHHWISVTGGVTLVNEQYNASFFGVSARESARSGNPVYRPGAGLKDVHLLVRWNWALSPAWMLSSSAQLRTLQGDARHSPLVMRPTNFSVSTGLAYRF